MGRRDRAPAGLVRIHKTRARAWRCVELVLKAFQGLAEVMQPGKHGKPRKMPDGQLNAKCGAQSATLYVTEKDCIAYRRYVEAMLENRACLVFGVRFGPWLCKLAHFLS